MKEQMSKGRRCYHDESAVLAVCAGSYQLAAGTAVAARYTPAPQPLSDRSASHHLEDALRNRRPADDGRPLRCVLPRDHARVSGELNFAPFVPPGREIQDLETGKPTDRRRPAN